MLWTCTCTFAQSPTNLKQQNLWEQVKVIVWRIPSYVRWGQIRLMRGRLFLYGFFVGWLCLCFESVLLKIKTNLWRISIVFCINLRFLNKLWNNHLSTENANIFRKRSIFWDRDRSLASPMYSLYVYCPTPRTTTNSHHSKHSYLLLQLATFFQTRTTLNYLFRFWSTRITKNLTRTLRKNILQPNTTAKCIYHQCYRLSFSSLSYFISFSN